MTILVTGGAGFIGSHTAVLLLEQGHEVIIVDNFSNSSLASVDRIKQITGKDVAVHRGDVSDKTFLSQVFSEHTIDAVIHFAGYKSVGESIAKPLSYYRNNIDSTLTLCEVMEQKDVRKLIFSSSATVYGEPAELPLKETSRTGIGISNPYGRTKYMIENILQDLAFSDPRWAITILRYFNPIGAHQSGLIGEDPNDTPNNLMPFVTQVAIGKQDHLTIFGDDYDTPDGTAIRDYIHVVDLAAGHLAALDHLKPSASAAVYNLGTGKGVSVLQIVHAFEKASGKQIPYHIAGRRGGDVTSSYADANKAAAELSWKALKTLDDACTDSWRWQSQNPNGFQR